MDEKQLKEIRGEVITRAIEIEKVLAMAIAVHYMGRVTWPFLSEVLYDQGFGWQMKVRIACRVNPKLASAKVVLDELSGIRNLFAHAGISVETGGRALVLNPKKPTDLAGIDFAAKYERFKELDAQFSPVMHAVMDDLGATHLPSAGQSS